MLKVMFVEGSAWQDVGKVTEVDSLRLEPSRGNILSADGQLMSSSLPNYKVYVDFRSGIDVPKTDTLYEVKVAEKKAMFAEHMDSICIGLADICPIKTPGEYKAHIQKGLDNGSRHYELCPGQTLDYIQYNSIMKLPIFNGPKYISGIIKEERNARKKPFGSLAKRTLGEMYGAKDSARSGLELAYDSVLRGKPGLSHRKKVLSKFIEITDEPAQNGCDLITTLDVNMQDICENALREEMSKLRNVEKGYSASVGVAVLMDVKTGDVKAIVNLERDPATDTFYEGRNYALASMMEPGSTFKTASFMVAMDDGYVHKSDIVDTGKGIEMMYGAKMKDHNWYKGGYHVIDVPHVLMVSSNIGTAKLIDKYYHKQPEKFVEGLRRIGIGTPLNLPFVGTADPQIRYPAKDRSNWPHTTIPWMSIGYETQIPPISIVTFYNAIANDGKMVKPRFVSGLLQNGDTVMKYPVEVIKQQICKKSTLRDIQEMLERVVCDKEGLGKPAGNPMFHVSGKTGTAQVSTGRTSGHGYGSEHLVSFCGYFPSDNPKYTCIVAIRHNHAVSSGGGQAGVVFSKISQRVLSKHVTREIVGAVDSNIQKVPRVKNGYTASAKLVLKNLGVKAYEDNVGEWCDAENGNNSLTLKNHKMPDQSVPDVKGMGARDAVYALESRGLKVKIVGRGKVTTQSLTAGSALVKGQSITLNLK